MSAAVVVQLEEHRSPADPWLARGVLGFPDHCPPERLLLGDAWLRRGDIATLISSAGAGKSVAAAQAAMAWALGRPYLGIAPARPLRVLLVSGEDDDVSLGEMREGLLEHAAACTGRPLTREDLQPLDDRLRVDFCRQWVGPEFFTRRLGPLLKAEPVDLVIVNPLLSFIGGDLVVEAPGWLRAQLAPTLQEHGCGGLVVSHTTRMAKDSWKSIDDTYSASGGGELANVPRSVLTLRPAVEAAGLWQVTVSKRQTTGWVDDQDNWAPVYYVRRAPSPTRPAWLPVEFAEARELIEHAGGDGRQGGQKAKVTDSQVADVVAALGGDVNQTRLRGELEKRYGVSESTSKRAVERAAESGAIRRREGDNPHGGHPLVFYGVQDHNGSPRLNL